MTLPTSGSISLGDVNTEFSLGHDLSDYYGVKWYKDDNSRGFFTANGGNNPPISMSEFYAKRGSIPVTIVNNASQSNGSTYTFPFYNKITVVVTGGGGGFTGFPGYDGCNGFATPGNGGYQGSASSFGSWGSASGGAPSLSGATTTIIFDADTDTVTVNGVKQSASAPLKDVTAISTLGAGGLGGLGGYNSSLVQTGTDVFGNPKYTCVQGANSSFGFSGAAGTIKVSVQ